MPCLEVDLKSLCDLGRMLRSITSGVVLSCESFFDCSANSYVPYSLPFTTKTSSSRWIFAFSFRTTSPFTRTHPLRTRNPHVSILATSKLASADASGRRCLPRRCGSLTSSAAGALPSPGNSRFRERRAERSCSYCLPSRYDSNDRACGLTEYTRVRRGVVAAPAGTPRGTNLSGALMKASKHTLAFLGLVDALLTAESSRIAPAGGDMGLQKWQSDKMRDWSRSMGSVSPCGTRLQLSNFFTLLSRSLHVK